MFKNYDRLMYIGPTIGGVAKSGAVFSGGLPKKLEKLAEEKPVIKSLIVPLSKIVQAKKAAGTEGTVEAVACRRVSELSETEIKEITEGV